MLCIKALYVYIYIYIYKCMNVSGFGSDVTEQECIIDYTLLNNDRPSSAVQWNGNRK